MQMFHLTKSQEQIYDASQFSAGAVSTLCGYVVLDQCTSPEELSQAINALYLNNDALRIRISEGAAAMQYVEEYREREIDRRCFSTMQAFSVFASDFAAVPLSLYGELSRFVIFTAEGNIGVILKIHHIVADAWSANLILNQLLSILKGERFGPSSFVGAVEREADYLSSPQYLRDKDYFARLIQDRADSVLVLDQPTSFSSAQAEYRIPDHIASSVCAFCHEQQITPAVFWLFCYSLALRQRMDFAKDFFIGVPVLNRVTRDELNTIGMFTHNIPVLIRHDLNKSVLENMVDSIEDQYLSALKHHRFTYSELMRSGRTGHQRLFDVIFSFLPKQENHRTLPKISRLFEQSQIETLQIHFDDHAGVVYYSYLQEAFTRSSISYFHDAVLCIAEAAIMRPDEPEGKCVYISDREMQKIDSVNRTAVRLPENTSLLHIFEQTLQAAPERACILTAEHTYSYAEFGRSVHLVDQAIRRILTGTQHVVAVYCNRSIEMYAALYAILRSGNIFLPVSPDYPDEYTAYLLSHSQAALLLTSDEFAGKEFTVRSVNVSKIIADSCEPATLPVIYGEIAYILFTSGSTGKPKGAAIRNDSLLNRILWMQSHYQLTAQDVILQKTPYTFDVSLWEIFWWSVSGAAMAVTAPYEHYLPQKILADIRRFKVTHLHFVPSVFDRLLDYVETDSQAGNDLGTLKHLFFSGEALRPETLARFKRIFPDNPGIHNLYGPTECAIDVTFYDCSAEEREIPIGKPIDNVLVYIVNERLQRVPFGARGQLALGGVCVGKEYVHDKEKTKERFVQNPFGDGMLFLTGDIVYLRDDMNLIFIGRNDKQVKINGQRIELSAIESALCQHDAVSSAVVLPMHEGSQTLLRAFYTGESVAAEVLRDFVRKKLPSYMVPHTWNHVEEFPITSHGKIDTQSLLSLPCDAVRDPHTAEPPHTDTEKKIADLFRCMLHKDQISRFDDFFMLGGTSLDMAALLADGPLSGISVFDFMRDASPFGIAQKLESRQSRDDRVFIPLVEVPNADDILVLFPFAGGDLSSFASLINHVRLQFPGTMIMGVNGTVDPSQVTPAANEILALSQHHTIRFYSHCAGIASAMAVLIAIEKVDPTAVAECIATAMIPPLPHHGRVKLIWRFLPDYLIGKILFRAGLPQGSTRYRQDLISTFRRDTDYFSAVLSAMSDAPLACPVRVLISRNDPFTRQIRNARKHWSRYFLHVGEIRVADYRTHYFQNTEINDIVSFIFGKSDRCTGE